MASRVPVETADEKPEDLVTGAEARPTLATQGNLGAAGVEAGVDEESLTAAEGAGEGGEKEPEEFDRRGRIADRRRLTG